MAKETKKEMRESEAFFAKSREELRMLPTLFDDIVALAKRADALMAFVSPEDGFRIRQDMSGLRLPVGQIEVAHMFAREAMAEISARLDAVETAARLLETNERPALRALR